MKMLDGDLTAIKCGVISLAFFALVMIGGFLLAVSEDAGIIVILLAGIIMSYSFWRLAHAGSEGKSAVAFAQEVGRAFPVLVALLCILGIIIALGNLTGIEAISEIGEDLIEIVGGD